MEQSNDQELKAIIDSLPSRIAGSLIQREDGAKLLLEVVLDLGREPEARFLDENYILSQDEVSDEDIDYVIQRIGHFGGDNRAGLERTLHRISAIRNRNGKIVGLTLRIGRAVYGTIRIIEDLIMTGKNLLFLGKPGVGKTTMLREVARVLADDANKRVVVVDTSNEIAGDGDIPHSGIGRARRMQVPSPELQHAVMIEGVENHMPEVIIIDEISTELEADAARTIAERGVQLVATAHGNTLENLIQNPTLSDLVGGVQAVTLGDIEARRRRTQKTVLERRAPPTFDILVEIHGWSQVAVHSDVAEVVDRKLRGRTIIPEIRSMDKQGNIARSQSSFQDDSLNQNGDMKDVDYSLTSTLEVSRSVTKLTHILPYGVNKGKLEQAIQGLKIPVDLVSNIAEADLLLTSKSFYRRRTQTLRDAEANGKPVYVLRKNTIPQIYQFFKTISRNLSKGESQTNVDRAVKEAQEAVSRVDEGDNKAALTPRVAYIRRLQHQVAEEHGLSSSSLGREPRRHVVIYPR